MIGVRAQTVRSDSEPVAARVKHAAEERERSSRILNVNVFCIIHVRDRINFLTPTHLNSLRFCRMRDRLKARANAKRVVVWFRTFEADRRANGK